MGILIESNPKYIQKKNQIATGYCGIEFCFGNVDLDSAKHHRKQSHHPKNHLRPNSGYPNPLIQR